jgi:hypothetical protein
MKSETKRNTTFTLNNLIAITREIPIKAILKNIPHTIVAIKVFCDLLRDHSDNNIPAELLKNERIQPIKIAVKILSFKNL